MSKEYQVLIFDFPNIDRSKVRPQHFKEVLPSIGNPIKAAGALYHDDERTKFSGSWFQLALDSREACIEFLKKDIYYREGIWDIDSAVIYPIGCAARLPVKLDGTPDELYRA
ncbi:uncharacterized protein J8A68_000447 [[Candida] subhashii]|uniref:YCII-related domain-containing protein n=1 Tax=[Candida] subhashii TaxID=561895 RepID=A0A8J5UUR5_9ASCO|nr:uncharacterized protein J8A68_000447 [[Candida] subhashii]KAG7666017.1 hypothetical protein J8A68_000447 [[Candida] subhashii]